MEQIGESQKQKKARTSWKNENVVKTFLQACIHEVAENGREGASLKALSWKKVAEILKNTHNFIVSQKQMKNHYDYLKGKYGAWSKLKNKTGNVYDPLTNMFNLSEDEWNIEMKTNKYVIPLKSTPLVFPQLCAQVFDGVATTLFESGGSSSMRARPYIEHIAAEDIQDLDEGQETSTSTPTPNCSSNVGVQRSTKKTKVSKDSIASTIERDMCKVLKLFIDKYSGPSVKDCYDKLQSLRWGKENPLHKMALVILCEGTAYRETWMLLQDDEHEDWVKMVGRKLGLVV